MVAGGDEGKKQRRGSCLKVEGMSCLKELLLQVVTVKRATPLTACLIALRDPLVVAAAAWGLWRTCSGTMLCGHLSVNRAYSWPPGPRDQTTS